MTTPVFPRANREGIKKGWTIDFRFLKDLHESTVFCRAVDYCDIEDILLAAENLLNQRKIKNEHNEN